MLIEFLSELTIELVFILTKKTISSSRNLNLRTFAKKQISKWKRRFHIRKVKFVNRESERRAIQEALEDSSHFRITYFFGLGGVGKTRLLEEVEELSQKASNRKNLFWAGIIDLYYEDLHSVSVIQDLIADRLDPNSQYFQQYRQARHKVKNQRVQGKPASEAERQKIDNLFFVGMAEFAEMQRPIIAFDTVENLSYESDVVQKICRIDDTSFLLREWLLKQFTKLSNGVILLAGRDDPAFLFDLQNTFRDEPECLEVRQIGGLTRADFSDILNLLVKETNMASIDLNEHIPRLHLMTDGLPVHLTLIVELLSNLGQFKELVDMEITDSSEWGRQFVRILFNEQSQQDRLFFLLAIARKGITVDLLHHLIPEWTKEECEQHLIAIKELGIVKTRDDGKEIFLHDVLYELFDRYPPPPKKIDQWLKRIADYYHAQIDQVDNDRTRWGMAIVKLLYYELRQSPKRAFEKMYMRWSEEAIRGFEVGLDMRLRNELLRFMRNLKAEENIVDLQLLVDQDSSLRWMQRSLMKGDFHKAKDIGETILSLNPKLAKETLSLSVRQTIHLSGEQYENAKLLFQKADSVFWARLLTQYGYSLTYLGLAEAKTQQVFMLAFHLLSEPSSKDEFAVDWLHDLSLGQLFDYQGYMLRNFGHYGGALKNYNLALGHYEALQFYDEVAYTLNNLAFALALLGKIEEAKENVEKSLAIRRRLGRKYPIALSYNTRGLIYCMQGEVNAGKQDGYLALNMFNELNSPRGKGLATLALGYMLRYQGKMIGSVQDAEAKFVEAEIFLRQSIEIFNGEVEEPVRLWEAFNESGSLHYNWARIYAKIGDKIGAQNKLEKAKAFHIRALNIAREHTLRFQEADTLDDLAYVLTSFDELSEANDRLKECFQLVPRQYHLQAGKKFQFDSQFGEAYWLILGKAHWQRGSLIVKGHNGSRNVKYKLLSSIDEAIEHLILSLNYLQRYSPTSFALNERIAQLSELLAESELSPSEIKSYAKAVEIKYQIDARLFFEVVNLA